VPFRFPLLETKAPSLYLQIAEKAEELSNLGMSICAVARALKVSDKTVNKALQHLRRSAQKAR